MPRVVVFGSSNTDMTVRVPRLPAPGQTILGSTFSTTPGGKGANQAVAARRAGAEVVFVTAVGDDDLGRQALELYQREGIDVSHVRVVEGVASGVALIFVGDDGENMIGVAPGANRRLSSGRRRRSAGVVVSRRTMCCWSAWRSPWRPRSAPCGAASRPGCSTILNPAPAPALVGVRGERAPLVRRRHHAQPRRGAGAGGHECGRGGRSPIGRRVADRLSRWGPRRW